MNRLKFFPPALFILWMGASPAFTQITWQKHPSPVVPVWSGGTNDPSAYKYTYEPAVLFDSTANLYRMWFSYQAYGFGVQWCIGTAVSVNGIHWYVHSRNPVLAPGSTGAFDSQALFDPWVIKVDNELRLYYDGYNGSVWQTGVATSSDGLTWTKYPGNPILTVRPGTWEAVGCNTAKVFHNGSQFVMFYTGHDVAMRAEVGLATSLDGYVWERSPLNPVLRRGPSGSWDQNSIRANAGFTGNGKYYLLYDGGSGTAIGFATSVDGAVWTKHPGNPVFFAGNPGSWDESRVEMGSVIREGSLLKFWYSGFGYSSAFGGSVWQIGYATSDFVTSVPERKSDLPQTHRLFDAFPNPFNPETEIRYEVSTTNHVTIKVFDVLGREVSTLVADTKTPGAYSVRWTPKSSASSVYYYRMTAGDFSEKRRMILLK